MALAFGAKAAPDMSSMPSNAVCFFTDAKGSLVCGSSSPRLTIPELRLHASVHRASSLDLRRAASTFVCLCTGTLSVSAPLKGVASPVPVVPVLQSLSEVSPEVCLLQTIFASDTDTCTSGSSKSTDDAVVELDIIRFHNALFRPAVGVHGRRNREVLDVANDGSTLSSADAPAPSEDSQANFSLALSFFSVLPMRLVRRPFSFPKLLSSLF
mmetsp:Transcript_109407/g.193389  ORF Transcript_109407/g.193389 Transcript_109407/m.193389 type:complete len:212 (-) Transcript_109407:349-984(-)